MSEVRKYLRETIKWHPTFPFSPSEFSSTYQNIYFRWLTTSSFHIGMKCQQHLEQACTMLFESFSSLWYFCHPKTFSNYSISLIDSEKCQPWWKICFKTKDSLLRWLPREILMLLFKFFLKIHSKEQQHLVTRGSILPNLDIFYCYTY